MCPPFNDASLCHTSVFITPDDDPIKVNPDMLLCATMRRNAYGLNGLVSMGVTIGCVAVHRLGGCLSGAGLRQVSNFWGLFIQRWKKLIFDIQNLFAIVIEGILFSFRHFQHSRQAGGRICQKNK